MSPTNSFNASRLGEKATVAASWLTRMGREWGARLASILLTAIRNVPSGWFSVPPSFKSIEGPSTLSCVPRVNCFQNAAMGSTLA